MYYKLRLFELKTTNFKTKYLFFVELSIGFERWRNLDFWRILDSLLYSQKGTVSMYHNTNTNVHCM